MVSTFKDEYRAILIAPQCPTDLWWSGDTLKAAMDLVDDAIKKYNGDPSRVYITGLSMGGMGSYEAAYEYTEKIAAIVPICGSPNWFNLDNGSAKSKMLIDMPLWAFHGDRDDVVSMDYEQTLIDQLHALGSDAKYTVYEGGRHDIWERAWCEDDLYPWLFSQTNKNMPLPDPKTPADNCWIIYAGILVVIVLISAAIIIIVKRGKKK